MKTLATILALAFVTVAHAWVLAWNAPTNQPVMSYYAPGTNQAYRLYGIGLSGTPTNQFQLLAVYTNWTVTTNGNQISYQGAPVLTNDPAPFFFVLTSSNTFGESAFSAMAITGPGLEMTFINSVNK